jgi:hypothetical protein
MRRITAHAKGTRLAIFVGLGLGSALYIGKYLASIGSSGDHYAQVWGTAISFLSLVSGIWFGIHQITHQKPRRTHADRPSDGDANISKTFTPVHLIVVGSIAALAFVVPPMVNRVAFSTWQSDVVTSGIKIRGGSTMKDGGEAHISLPNTKHGQLDIIFRLESKIATGSCVAPARLTAIPTHNGNDQRGLGPFQSGTSQTITFNKKAVPTELRVSLDLSEEPTCAVRLSVVDARYSH